MSYPWAHINRDHMLRDTASWEALSSTSEDSELDPTETYASAVTIRCNADGPNAKWANIWPNFDFDNEVVLFLAHNSTVKRRDRVTFNSKVYRVTSVDDWRGAGRVARLSMTESA